MKTQTMNTRANQLSALQATVLTQVLSALGSYAQQKKHLSSDSRKIESGDASLPTRLIRSHRTATNTTDALMWTRRCKTAQAPCCGKRVNPNQN